MAFGPKARSVGWLLAATALAATAFVGGRLSARRNRVTTAEEASSAPTPASADGRAARHRTQWRVLPPLTQPPAAPDPSTAEDARLARAGFLLDRIFTQLDMASRVGVLSTPEARANAVRPYLAGLLEGAVQADPQIRGAFSTQFTSALCDKELSVEQTIALAHLAIALPDVATTRAFDCFFSTAKEDISLWSMLDAWRQSGLEKSAALARVEASAKDSRTTRRFLSQEEAQLQRTPVEYRKPSTEERGIP